MCEIGITRGTAIVINDFLDNCAEIKPGDEVVIAVHVDGMYGGDNIVDPLVIAFQNQRYQYQISIPANVANRSGYLN